MRRSNTLRKIRRTMLRMLLAVMPLTICNLQVEGQPVDSLYHIYLNAPEQDRIQASNAVFKQLARIQFTDTLLEISKDVPKEQATMLLNYWMAEYYFAQGKYELSLDACNRAKHLLNKVKDNHLKSDLLGTLSNTQYRLGNYDDALKTLYQAYVIDKQSGDDELISSDLNSLAAIYLAVQLPGPGIKHIEKAIAIERKMKRPDRLAIRLGMASELYLLNNEPEKALKAIDEAYKIDSDDHRAEKAAIRLAQKGAILEHLSRYNESLSTLQQAIPVLDKAGNAYSLAVCYNQMGSILDKLGHQQEAANYYKKALQVSIKCGSPKIERIAERGLWETLKDVDPNIAMLHLERYTTLTDSMTVRIASAQAGVMEATTQHIGEDEMIESNQRFNMLIKWIATIFGILLLLILAGLFYSWRKSRSALRMHRQTQEIRSHFFSNITNELHTPLTVIMNAGNYLLGGTKTTVEENKHIGDMIVKHGQNMLGIVNSLLDIDMTRAKSEAPMLKTGDIVMYIRMLVDNFMDSANQHLIHLEYTSDTKSKIVVFAPEYIKRILHELIANALKYTPRNGKVNVKLITLDDNRLRLVVADTGKGIPLDNIKSIYEPFYQSINDDDGVETVVGLALVNQLVKAMNGTIDIDSAPGQGTAFTIEFPVQTATASDVTDGEDISLAETLVQQSSEENHQKPLVFIVENTEDVAYFIASHLKDKYNVRFARDGREAQQNVQDLVPDLIITEQKMPVMDGKELIKRLRKDASLRHIPIIAITASTSEHERLACYEAGADNVLVKPFNSSELRLIADHLIHQQSTLRERVIKTSDSMSRPPAASQLSKEDQDFINKLVDVIHVQMARDDIDMEHIAAALSLSRKQLRTRVMAITNLTPVAYVLQVRLNYARRMISSENDSLTNIASKCGFQNLSHFSKAFKQQFGISPMQFRKNIDDPSQATTGR
ncbi:MAG: helix-turn-helix domain-containing protein [Muribaculaceae bacterium]|nr:helix-turn-helix domain-containing protein [Muribaculaceae bacterium]